MGVKGIRYPITVLAVLGTVAVSCVVGVLSMSINRGAPDPLVGVLATFGLATFLDSLVLTIFGKDPMVRQPFDTFWELGQIRVSPQAGINLSVAVVLLLALYVWLYRTPIGRDMRACAASALAATLAGIPVKRISLLTYMAGGLLAGIAGVLILYTTGTNYSAGLGLTIWGFGAAVLFGMTKPLRGFAGGIAIGIVQGIQGALVAGVPEQIPVGVGLPRVVDQGTVVEVAADAEHRRAAGEFHPRGLAKLEGAVLFCRLHVPVVQVEEILLRQHQFQPGAIGNEVGIEETE